MRFLSGSYARILIVGALLLVGWVAVGYRLFVLQVIQASDLSSRAERQHERSHSLEGQRGTVFDRRGRILATNVDVPSIYAIPSILNRHKGDVKKLARVLSIDDRVLHRRFNGNPNFVWIDRKINPSIAQRVQQSNIDGVGILDESQRFYPKRQLLGHILGFAGVDNQGLEGIELKYDRYLRGGKGWVVVERDAFGRAVFPKGLDYVAPSRGKDLILTIDEVIQYIAERELDAVMEKSLAIGGTAIVMNPRSGEILAMAVRPEFNPNGQTRNHPEHWRNRAVTDPYEPGSTLKIVTAAAALEERVTSPEDVLYCEEGRMALGGGAIHDHEGHGYLSFRDIIGKSSNIGTVKVALRIGERRLFHYMRAFGFGAKTGIDIIGESPGILRDVDSWSLRSLASIAIGQEMAATPIQIVSAVSAVANGGWLVRPRLVSEIREADGQVVKRFPVEIKRQVISQGTADTLMQILEGAVSESGTGTHAMIPGYRVAGKTGTAQKIDPLTGRYSRVAAVSSFVGIAPAEDPAVVVLVVVDHPRGETWGGSVAAPAFRNITQQVLRYLDVAPKTRDPMLVTSIR